MEESKLREAQIKDAFSGDENLKRQALRGFEKGKKASDELMNEFFLIEKETIQKIDNMLRFLSEKAGPFWEFEGSLVFEKDEDVDSFDQLVESLNEHSQKEYVILEKLENHKQSSIQKMKNLQAGGY